MSESMEILVGSERKVRKIEKALAKGKPRDIIAAVNQVERAQVDRIADAMEDRGQ